MSEKKRAPCPKCGDERLVCYWGSDGFDWYCTECELTFNIEERHAEPHLGNPQSFMRWINSRGGAISIDSDASRPTLRLHWPASKGPMDDAGVTAALRTHEASLISWIEAVRDNHEMMVGRRYDPGSMICKAMELQGDGIVQTQGTKLLNAGVVVADGRLLIFQPHQIVKDGDTVVVAEAWFDNGTPTGVKVRSVPWTPGKWVNGEFIPE